MGARGATRPAAGAAARVADRGGRPAAEAAREFGGPVKDLHDVASTFEARFHAAMLERGVFLPPSQFEAWFLSTAHKPKHLEATLAAALEALRGA